MRGSTVTDNPYSAPAAALQERGKPLPVAVKTPKAIYFIAVFFFLAFGIQVKALQRIVVTAINDPQATQLIGLLCTLLVFALPIALARFNRTAVLASGILMAIMAVSYVVTLGMAVFSGVGSLLMVVVTLAIAGLLGVCARYCLRQRTLDAAAMRAAYREHVAMTREVQKRLARR